MMTRKHFTALAKVLKDSRTVMDFNVHDSLVRQIADICSESNAGFDYHRFYNACDYQKDIETERACHGEKN
jgi:hypothetical protein